MTLHMTPEEYNKLQEQLQLERDKNFDLKFQNLNTKMDEAISLLKDNMHKHDINKDAIVQLQEKQRNCPINAVKSEMGRYARETRAIRGFSSSHEKYWVTHTIVTMITVVVTVTLLIVFKFKGVVDLIF